MTKERRGGEGGPSISADRGCCRGSCCACIAFGGHRGSQGVRLWFVRVLRVVRVVGVVRVAQVQGLGFRV